MDKNMKKKIFWQDFWKVVLIGVLFLLGHNIAQASNDELKRDGNTFIAEKTARSSSSSDISTVYKWSDNKGNTYPIYLHKFSKGENQGKYGAYVFRKSEKTGKEYKYFFPNNQKIAEVIINELGIKE
jgi:hypothetical protein